MKINEIKDYPLFIKYLKFQTMSGKFERLANSPTTRWRNYIGTEYTHFKNFNPAQL